MTFPNSFTATEMRVELRTGRDDLRDDSELKFTMLPTRLDGIDHTTVVKPVGEPGYRGLSTIEFFIAFARPYAENEILEIYLTMGTSDEGPFDAGDSWELASFRMTLVNPIEEWPVGFEFVWNELAGPWTLDGTRIRLRILRRGFDPPAVLQGLDPADG